MNKLWKTMGKAPQIKAFAGVYNQGRQESIPEAEKEGIF
jgi:hypothetical protein